MNKQIELERWAMAEILAKNFHINGEGWDASDFEWSAHCLQMDGYLKTSAVAREIFAEIDKLTVRFINDADYTIGNMILDIIELKKKYESEGAE